MLNPLAVVLLYGVLTDAGQGNDYFPVVPSRNSCDVNGNYPIKSACRVWCLRGPKSCGNTNCAACSFCNNGDTDSVCSLSILFVDVTSSAFPKWDTYWYELKHSGRPYSHEGAPLFVDIDNDGRLDYFNSMHGHPTQSAQDHGMELGTSVNRSDIFPRFRHVSERIVMEDEGLDTLDPHGENILDLDGDGFLDIMISSGGGRGIEMSDIKKKARYNFLFWGEGSTDEMTGESITIFRGGRYAAKDARIAMNRGRGRINYIFDANRDGKLDIFCLQDRGVTDKIAPGVLEINQGDRTWQRNKSMREYTRAMILTDADGDGYAQEILLNRAFCFPQRNDYGSNPNSLPKGVATFCRTRPVGTTAVYKFNTTSNKMEEISENNYNVTTDDDDQPACCPHGLYVGANDCHAKSMASADFDGDEKADHIILFGTTMLIYFSTDREVGQLPIGKKILGVEIAFPPSCNSAESVRVVDLDNDGTEEILVMCDNPGSFLIYQMGKDHKNWVVDNGNWCLGALNNVSRAGMHKSDIRKVCNDVSNWPKVQKTCQKYKKDNIIPQLERTAGLCLVDLDNDGFLDATVSHKFGYLRFLKNVPSSKSKLNKFIAFQLQGDGINVNRYGIGATVLLQSSTNETKSGYIKQFREVSSYQHTSDRYGCKEDRIIFGLGKYRKPTKVFVRWPNGFKENWPLSEIWSFSEELEPMTLPYNKHSTPSVTPTDATFTPTVTPTYVSTMIQASAPTLAATSTPISQPTNAPTDAPFTPTVTPTYVPPMIPTSAPAVAATSTPTSQPTNAPTDAPFTPTVTPTYVSTMILASAPTVAATSTSTNAPSDAPLTLTVTPTYVSTMIPTSAPTVAAPSTSTNAPSDVTFTPAVTPKPTSQHTNAPTSTPTRTPSDASSLTDAPREMLGNFLQ